MSKPAWIMILLILRTSSAWSTLHLGGSSVDVPNFHIFSRGHSTFHWGNEWKLIYFPLSLLQKLLATSQKFYSVFPQLEASFANTLIFPVSHFLGMPKSQMYLTRHCSITACAIALFQAGSSCTGTDSTLSTYGVEVCASSSSVISQSVWKLFDHTT